MANNSTTSDDEKSTHQQRIDAMLAEHDAIAQNLSAVDAWDVDDDSRWSCVRHHYEPHDLKRETVLAAEVRRLREERDLFRTASEAAELRIVELREQNLRVLKNEREALNKLARVEALVQHGAVTQKSVFEALQSQATDEPQPEREPKLPYNGY